MRRVLIVFVIATTSVVLLENGPVRVIAQQGGVPEIRYRSVANFLKLPADLYLGEVAGVAVMGAAVAPR
jgi:hypothetical protein